MGRFLAEPTMVLNVSSTVLRRRLGQLLEAVETGRTKVLVTRGGTPSAAMVDITALERLRKLVVRPLPAAARRRVSRHVGGEPARLVGALLGGSGADVEPGVAPGARRELCLLHDGWPAPREGPQFRRIVWAALPFMAIAAAAILSFVLFTPGE